MGIEKGEGLVQVKKPSASSGGWKRSVSTKSATTTAGSEAVKAPARKSSMIGARRRAKSSSGTKPPELVPEKPLPKRSDTPAPLEEPELLSVEKAEATKEKEEKKVIEATEGGAIQQSLELIPQKEEPIGGEKKASKDEEKAMQERRKRLINTFLTDSVNSIDLWITEVEALTEKAENAEQLKTITALESKREYVAKWIPGANASMVSMRETISNIPDEGKRERYLKRIKHREDKLKRLERRCKTFDHKSEERKQRLRELSEEFERELLNQAEIDKKEFDRMLGLKEMDMDGDTPKQLPNMAKLHEATIMINELARKRNAHEEPLTEFAIASRASTNQIIEQMKVSATEFEKRYRAYIKKSDGNITEANAAREQEMVNQQKRATYLAHKRDYQKKDRERMAKMLADPQSGVMRLIGKLKQLKAVEGDAAQLQAAQRLARGQDNFESVEEIYEPINEWGLGAGGSLATMGTLDTDEMLKGFAKEEGKEKSDLFKNVAFMSLLAPLVDGLNIIHDVYVFMNNSKHMTPKEKLKGIGEIIVNPGISFLLDGASSVLTILGVLDNIPIIGTFIGIIGRAVNFAKQLVKFHHSLDDHYAMQEKKEFLREKLEETKRKLEVKGAKGDADMVLLPEEKRKRLKKNALLSHAEGLTAGFSTENLAKKQSEWKEERRKGDETHRKEYYQAKVSQITKDYLMADDTQVKSNKTLSDLSVDVTKESLGLVSTIAKIFPGIGTAVGITLDAVSLLIGGGYELGKKISQSVTDHKHPDSDTSSQSKKTRGNAYSKQLMNDLEFLGNQINSKGEYTGQEKDRSYVAAKMNNLRQMLKHIRCPISKLISAKTMSQFGEYMVDAFI